MREGVQDPAEPARPAPQRYRFESVEVDVAARIVLRDGQRQALEPKAFAVLLLLLERHGRLLTRDDLLDAVWGHRHVTPGVLTRVIAQLRHALADDAQHPRMIETRHALGYRFVAPLQDAPAAAVAVTSNGAGEGADDASAARAVGEQTAAASDPDDALATAAKAPGNTDPVHASAAHLAGVEVLPDTLPGASAAEQTEQHANSASSAVADSTRGGAQPTTTATDAHLADPITAAATGRVVTATDAQSPPAASSWTGANRRQPVAAAPAVRTRWRGWRRLRRPLSAALVVLLGVTAWWTQRTPPVRTIAADAPAAAASVAVLPFSSIGGDDDDRYFADGLSQEMHGALAEVPGLKVAGWHSGVAARNADVKALGKQLGVGAVLDGSVQRDGKQLRVQARLTDTRNGFVLWSRSYDRGIGDLFKTQAEIANDVVISLRGSLPDGGAGLRQRLQPTRNASAYADYLRGIGLLGSDVEGADSRAISAFNAALDGDAGFAAAQAYLCRIQLRRFETASDPGALDAAKAACTKARSLDPGQPQVRTALGDLYRLSGEADRAAVEYRAALAARPDQAGAAIGLGILDLAAKRRSEAVARFDAVTRQHPDDALIRAEIGYQYYLAGDLARATAMYADAVRLSPATGNYWATYGALQLAAGDLEHAERALRRAAMLEPNAITYLNLGEVAYGRGHYTEAAALQRQAIGLDAQYPELWTNLAEALAAAGAPAAEVREASAEAARRLHAFLETEPDAAPQRALLGVNEARLGNAAAARASADRAGRGADPTGEAAFTRAATYALLGDLPAARGALQAARAAGISESRIARYVPFIRAGLVPPPARAVSPVRSAGRGASSGGQ